MRLEQQDAVIGKCPLGLGQDSPRSGGAEAVEFAERQHDEPITGSIFGIPNILEQVRAAELVLNRPIPRVYYWGGGVVDADALVPQLGEEEGVIPKAINT